MALTGHTVFVLRALGLGDLLTAVPALRALRGAYPASRIVLAAPRPLADLVPLTRAVDTVLPTSSLESLRPPSRPPDVAVNLHGRGPQSIAAALAMGAPTVFTHAHPAYPELEGPQWKQGQHEVQRWCRLVRYYGIDADPADLLLSQPGSSTRYPGAVVLHPGASHESRRWPQQRFADLARWLLDQGYRVLITGNHAERPLAFRTAHAGGVPDGWVLAGRTSLPQLAALVADARLVVCGDTGVAHLATAYRTPSVVLFGPVSPDHWGPPGRPQHTVLWAGRNGDTFADRPDPGLLRLSVPAVIEAAAATLDRTAHERLEGGRR